MRSGMRSGRAGMAARSGHESSSGRGGRSGGARMEWWRYIHYDTESRPQVTWRLIRRVLGYAKPYRIQLALTLLTIIATALIEAANPILFRQLIDIALPNQDVGLLDRLALGIIAIPLASAAIGILQQYLSSVVGEGVI